MNNVIHINSSDPIIDQLTKAADKQATLKTLAFKYFGGDTLKLNSYLQTTGHIDDITVDESHNDTHEYRQLAMF